MILSVLGVGVRPAETSLRVSSYLSSTRTYQTCIDDIWQLQRVRVKMIPLLDDHVQSGTCALCGFMYVLVWIDTCICVEAKCCLSHREPHKALASARAHAKAQQDAFAIDRPVHAMQATFSIDDIMRPSTSPKALLRWLLSQLLYWKSSDVSI